MQILFIVSVLQLSRRTVYELFVCGVFFTVDLCFTQFSVLGTYLN